VWPSEPPIHDDGDNARSVEGATLSVEHVTKRFGGVTAVDDVSFTVAPGEALAVIGPNGAGKSSLLKLMSGSYRPDSGTIRFGTTRLNALPAHAIARHGIGLAHQIPQPFSGLTVRENIAIGAMTARRGHRIARRELVDHVLDTCGLADKAALPASHLRLLDLKRLELARALSVDPSLILLDEVAAGLNGQDLEAVTSLIAQIHEQGRSVILVEHVEGVVASLVDRVIVIDWGKVIAEGTPGEVAENQLVREVYLGAGRAPTSTAPAASTRAALPTPPLLRATDVTATYGDIVALRQVDLAVHPQEIVAVLGANGAGKSTLAATISGQLLPQSGLVELEGTDITALPSFARARMGISHCPEGRRIFSDLTIEENLSLAVPLRLPKAELRERLSGVRDIFPALADRTSRPAGALSGGQQQMLAIGRALMSSPRLLVCDEISLGLAPVAIDELYAALPLIRERDVSVVLIEQNVHRSLSIADRVYVLERGRVSYAGDPAALNDDEALNDFYFGKRPTAPVPRRVLSPLTKDNQP